MEDTHIQVHNQSITTSISVLECPILQTMQPFFIRSSCSLVTTFLLPTFKERKEQVWACHVFRFCYIQPFKLVFFWTCRCKGYFSSKMKILILLEFLNDIHLSGEQLRNENTVIIKAEVMDVTAWGSVPVQVITTSICRMTSLSLTTRKPSMLCGHIRYFHLFKPHRSCAVHRHSGFATNSAFPTFFKLKL